MLKNYSRWNGWMEALAWPQERRLAGWLLEHAIILTVVNITRNVKMWTFMEYLGH